MEEDIKPISDINTQVEEVNPTSNISQTEVVNSYKKKNRVLLIIIIVLLLSILGMVANYIITRTPVIAPVESDENISEDNLEEENSEYTVFDMEEYKFSAKVPTYTLIDEEDEDFSGKYFWVAGEFDYFDSEMIDWYNDYLITLEMNFYPNGEGPGCHFPCGQIHVFSVHIWVNTGEKNLSEVNDVLTSNINSMLSGWSEMDETPISDIDSVQATMWDRDVYKLSGLAGNMDGVDEGYLVVTPEFVYLVEYFINPDTNEESINAANSLLNSFEFGD